MKTVPLHVESPRGHDTFNVPQNQLQKEVETQLIDDRWVTLEKEDGSTEILTEKDLPKEKKDEKPDSDWRKTFSHDNGNACQTTTMPKKTITNTKDFAKKFEKVKSITSTMKAKGG